MNCLQFGVAVCKVPFHQFWFFCAMFMSLSIWSMDGFSVGWVQLHPRCKNSQMYIPPSLVRRGNRERESWAAGLNLSAWSQFVELSPAHGTGATTTGWEWDGLALPPHYYSPSPPFHTGLGLGLWCWGRGSCFRWLEPPWQLSIVYPLIREATGAPGLEQMLSVDVFRVFF